MQHPAGHDELSQAFVKPYKHLIRRENHVFMAGRWSYGFYLAAGIFQSRAKGLPLLPSLQAVNRRLPHHVRILLVNNIEMGRRTKKNLRWHL